MRNCLTFVFFAKLKFGGKIIVHSWSGAWRKQEWPVMPHFALKTKCGTLVHWKARAKNLPLWKMWDFDGDVIFEHPREK
jgi:hypothetical protein